MGALEGDLITLLTGIGMVLALVFVLVWYILRRRRRGEDRMADRAQDLQRLERKAALTPEEKKKIREAMARQYLGEQKEMQKHGPMPKGVHDLMVEAERLEMELQRKREAGELPAEKPRLMLTHPAFEDLTKPEKRAPEAGIIPPLPRLPEHLRHLAGKSRHELEDLKQAGFLPEDDYRRLIDHLSGTE